MLRPVFRSMIAMVAFGAALQASTAAQQPHTTKAPATRSSMLTVIGPDRQVTLSVSDLQALPQVNVTVHNAHTNQDERYAGARLSDVLAKVMPAPSRETLRSYVTAAGTDGYWVLYSGEEISEVVHAGTVIVAVTRDGQAIDADGAMKLVSTEDKKPERWVRNLATVRWHAATE